MRNNRESYRKVLELSLWLELSKKKYWYGSIKSSKNKLRLTEKTNSKSDEMRSKPSLTKKNSRFSVANQEKFAVIRD